MNAMLARIVATLLVLVLMGPSMVAVTCELTCAVASHHQSTPSSTEASCHEHQGPSPGVGVGAANGVLCHESGDPPFAVIDGWLNTVAVSASPAATVVIRPAHRPLRV